MPSFDCPCFCDNFSYNGFAFLKYRRMTSLAVTLMRLTDDDDDTVTLSGSIRRVVDGLGSLRNTDENLDREKYFDGGFLFCWWLMLMKEVWEVGGRRSASATEEGREESQPASVEKEEWESEEWRESVQAEEEEVEEEERRRVRTIEIRGERWRGRS